MIARRAAPSWTSTAVARRVVATADGTKVIAGGLL
jgi:hypothetical protein